MPEPTWSLLRLAVLGALLVPSNSMAQSGSLRVTVPSPTAASLGKFGDVLARAKSQTETVLKTLDSAQTRSRAMGRVLKKVEALPDPQSQALIAPDRDFDKEADED